MAKAGYKQIIVTLWLISFVAQALASVSLCCENLGGKNRVLPSSQLELQRLSANGLATVAINHVQHQKSPSFLNPHLSPRLNPQSVSDIAESTAQCNTDCDCAIGGCTPAVLSTSQTTFNTHFIAPENTDTNSPLDHFISSVFRPPISR